MRRFQHEALKRTSTHHGLSNMASIGGPEVLIIIVVFFVLFGARRLPELANALGRSKGEFQKGCRKQHRFHERRKPSPTSKRVA